MLFILLSCKRKASLEKVQTSGQNNIWEGGVLPARKKARDANTVKKPFANPESTRGGQVNFAKALQEGKMNREKRTLLSQSITSWVMNRNVFHNVRGSAWRVVDAIQNGVDDNTLASLIRGERPILDRESDRCGEDGFHKPRWNQGPSPCARVTRFGVTKSMTCHTAELKKCVLCEGLKVDCPACENP